MNTLFTGNVYFDIMPPGNQFVKCVGRLDRGWKPLLQD